MHDPKTVAHEIYGLRGWLAKRRRDKGIRYDDKDPKFAWRSPLVTIWHVDPETDGSDDSCGYSYPRIAKGLRERAEKIAASEWDFMFGRYAYKYQQPSAHEVVYALWKIIAWRMFKRRSLNLHEFQEIADLAANPTDNLRAVVFDAARSPEQARRLGALMLRCYVRLHRPWWRHPKWHVYHWQVQIHFTQKLKRWLFSRCKGCGKRYQWGYSPISANWHGKGPRWFRSEDSYHSECRASRIQAAA